MNTPARFKPDTTSIPRPQDPPERNPRNAVSFVVDTAGIPEATTFRVIFSADSALIADVRRTFMRWRFTPAMVGPCKVKQLIQTPVVR